MSSTESESLPNGNASADDGQIQCTMPTIEDDREGQDDDDDDEDDELDIQKEPCVKVTMDRDVLEEVNRFHRKQPKGHIDVWWLFDDGGSRSMISGIVCL